MSTALVKARDRGGDLVALVERFLADHVTLALENHEEKVEADQALTRARQKAEIPARAAHLLVGKHYDELWNALGRPRADVRLAALFPSAGSTGTNLALASQPIALRSLANRLNQGLHPRLSAARCRDMAAEITAAAMALDRALTAVTEAQVAVAHRADLEKTLARLGHFQLAALKRALFAEGLRATEIDEVIPPAKRRKTAPAVTPPVDPGDAAETAPADEPAPADDPPVPDEAETDTT